MLVVFGERHYGRGGRAILLRDAEHRDVQLQLPHTSVITGRITKEDGTPAIGASVFAVRFSMAWVPRRAIEADSATTDSRGVFRLGSLTPGDYAVCASTHETNPLNEGQRRQTEIDRQRRAAAFVLGPEGLAAQRALAPQLAALEAQLPRFLPPVRGYAPVCFREATSMFSMITVAPDEERRGVDLSLVLTRLARIEGTVTGMPSDGRDLDPIMLFSADELHDLSPVDVTRPNIDGRFTFTQIPPGHYQLLLRAVRDPSHASPRVGAAADIVVANEDIHDIVLNLQRGVTVSGHIVFRGTGREPPTALTDAPALEVRLDPVVPGPLMRWPGSSTTSPDANGQFVLHDVFPGQYRVSTNGESQRDGSSIRRRSPARM